MAKPQSSPETGPGPDERGEAARILIKALRAELNLPPTDDDAPLPATGPLDQGDPPGVDPDAPSTGTARSGSEPTLPNLRTPS